MKTIIYPVLIILLICSIASGQIIRKDEKIRAGFGVSGLLNNDFNTHIDKIQLNAASLGPEIYAAHFKDHFTVFFEYESEITRDFSYLVHFQYHSDKVSDTGFDLENEIEQGMSNEFYIYEAGLSIAYYFPFIKLGDSDTKVFVGGGGDISYVEMTPYYFYYQEPIYLQTIKGNYFGIIFGGRIYIGVEIPFVESLFIQLRAGYSYRPDKALAGETDESVRDELNNKGSLMDPLIFEENKIFNFSQAWITVSMAYKF